MRAEAPGASFAIARRDKEALLVATEGNGTSLIVEIFVIWWMQISSILSYFIFS